MLRGCGGAPTRCPGGALPAGTLIGCLPNNILAVNAGSKLGELSSFRELYSAVRALAGPRLWYYDKADKSVDRELCVLTSLVQPVMNVLFTDVGGTAASLGRITGATA